VLAKIQSHKENKKPFHVAIIMDGNGRWANKQNRPRFFGHRAGAENLRHVVEKCPELGITTLSAYAFSSDNWGRPQQEVNMLMRLFHTYLQVEIKNLIKNGVRLTFIGRRDRLDKKIVKMMEQAEKDTAHGKILNLRLIVDYSAKDMLIEAARLSADSKQFDRETFAAALAKAQHGGVDTPDVDLLIRTGGEQRLSDFLLWECAYAEFYFSQVMWPEFDGNYLEIAVNEFKHRNRRFGRIPDAIAV